MEATETPGAAAAVLDRPDDSAQPSAQPAPGDSGGTTDGGVSQETQAFRAFLQADRDDGRDPTSKPDAAATDVQSAPRGDEAASGPERGSDGRWIPRRGIPKAVEAAESRAAAAERKLTELDPAALREQIRAEVLAEQEQKAEASRLDQLAQTREADVRRYLDLRDTPDANLSGDDYAWREDFKDKLKALPEVEELHKELTRQEVEAERAKVSRREETFLNGMAAQMGRVGSRYGVDTASKGATFETIAEAIAAAVESRVRAEYREVEEENRQLRLTGPRGLASARAPLNGGASNGAPPAANESDLLRRFLRA